MQTIGNKLEEARKKLGISIVEAAESTKIRGEFLRNFESDNFDFDLPEIYKHGFLKTYSRFLKLDPEKINTDYQAYRLGKSTPSFEVPVSKTSYGRKDFSEAGSDSFSGGSTVIADSLSEDDEDVAVKPASSIMIDKALYLRVAVIALAFVLSITLLVVLFSIIFGGSSNEQADSNLELREDPIENISSVTADTSVLTFEALGDVRFRVTDLDSRELLFNGNLEAGQSITIEDAENITRIQIVATQRQNLATTFRGERYTFDQVGPGTLNLVE